MTYHHVRTQPLVYSHPVLIDPPEKLEPFSKVESEPTPRGVWIVVAVACAAMLVASTRNAPTGLSGAIHIGLLFGTMWGQITAAAAWFAFRPALPTTRARDSLVWCGVVLVTVVLNMSLNAPNGAPILEFLGVIGTCLCGQWILIQAPLWSLKRFCGVRLSRDWSADATGPLQFGMRHLLIFTTVIGVVLGLGRLLFLSGLLTPSPGSNLLVFLVLTIASLLSTLPMILAVWMRRWTAAAMLVALVFGGIVLAGEVQWWRHVELRTVPFLYGVHGIQLSWILLVGFVVRAAGYRLIRSREFATPAEKGCNISPASANIKA